MTARAFRVIWSTPAGRFGWTDVVEDDPTAPFDAGDALACFRADSPHADAHVEAVRPL